MKKHTIAGLVLAGLAVAPLTGCGDGKDAPPPVGTPVASSPSTPKPSTSTSPTPPPEAMKNTKDGAEAFIRWYLVRQWDAATTRDASLVAAYVSPKCTGCSNLEAAVSKNRESGTRPSGTYTVTAVSALRVAGGTQWLATATSKITNVAAISNGKTTPWKDNEFKAKIEIAFKNDSWLVLADEEL